MASVIGHLLVIPVQNELTDYYNSINKKYGKVNQRSFYIGLYCGIISQNEGIEPVKRLLESLIIPKENNNFLKSIYNWCKSGFKIISKKEQKRRLAICYSCEHFSGIQCKLCGCISGWKTKLASEHCPDEPPKW